MEAEQQAVELVARYPKKRIGISFDEASQDWDLFISECPFSDKPQEGAEPSPNRRTTTGSIRDDRSGKGRMDLIPPTVLLDAGVALEAGADKYEERNWELGQPLSWYYDSGMRHLLQWWEGKTNEDHLRSAFVNLMMALHTREMIRRGVLSSELDDKPDYTRAIEKEATNA